ncbi:hypothetical protein AVEN_153827-1 [Araneus ventricosus]|uniref:Uncharacterized protein n=1 Tax=Araneus ventricosus TaxID=182803 RepID=A0A4Y2WAL9_ARAVE|nr:hypothetical protein AVEN_153827-1 [Araneus ventricosus]
MNNSRRKNNKETEGRVPMAINGLGLTLSAVGTSRHRSEGNSTLHHYQERELNTSPLLREESPPTIPRLLIHIIEGHLVGGLMYLSPNITIP